MGKRQSILLLVVSAMLLMVIGTSMAFWLSGGSNDAVMAATMPTISRTVKDDAGKPVRGAVVSATSSSGRLTISRYTNAAGQYKIPEVEPDAYQVSATGWGFEKKVTNKNLTGDAEMNFTLDPKWDPDAQLSIAEWLTYFPKNTETVKVEGCAGCHTFSWILKERGMRGATAEQWKAGLASMERKVRPAGGTEATKAEVFALLEKYFGPKATLPRQD